MKKTRGFWERYAKELLIIFIAVTVFATAIVSVLLQERSILIQENVKLGQVVQQAPSGTVTTHLDKSNAQIIKRNAQACLLSENDPRFLEEWSSGDQAPSMTLDDEAGTSIKPGIFRVRKGESVTIDTGCGASTVVQIREELTLTSLSHQDREWSFKMEGGETRTVSEFSTSTQSLVETDRQVNLRSTTVQSSDVIDFVSGSGVIQSGTDVLIPILVTPKEVYFRRVQVGC